MLGRLKFVFKSLNVRLSISEIEILPIQNSPDSNGIVFRKASISKANDKNG